MPPRSRCSPAPAEDRRRGAPRRARPGLDPRRWRAGQREARRGAPAPSLVGTQWRLESLAGRLALDGVEATLEFPDADHIAGNCSCNRFGGAVTVTGERLQVGAIAATRRACEPARMEQENRGLAALGAAERFAIDGGRLTIRAYGLDQPLTFARSKWRRCGCRPVRWAAPARSERSRGSPSPRRCSPR